MTRPPAALPSSTACSFSARARSSRLAEMSWISDASTEWVGPLENCNGLSGPRPALAPALACGAGLCSDDMICPCLWICAGYNDQNWHCDVSVNLALRITTKGGDGMVDGGSTAGLVATLSFQFARPGGGGAGRSAASRRRVQRGRSTGGAVGSRIAGRGRSHRVVLERDRIRDFGFTAQHFDDRLKAEHEFALGYSRTKLRRPADQQVALVFGQSQQATTPAVAQASCSFGTTLRHAWLAGQPPLDLVATIGRRGGRVRLGLLVVEEGAVLELAPLGQGDRPLRAGARCASNSGSASSRRRFLDTTTPGTVELVDGYPPSHKATFVSATPTAMPYTNALILRRLSVVIIPTPRL